MKRDKYHWLKLSPLIVLFFLVFAWTMRSQSSVTVFYVVTAVDSIGRESAFSNEASVAIPPGKSIALAWQASTSAVTGYNVYRSLTTGTGYVKIGSTALLGFTDLPPNPPTSLTAK